MTAGPESTDELIEQAGRDEPGSAPRADQRVAFAVAGIAAAGLLVGGLIIFVLSLAG